MIVSVCECKQSLWNQTLDRFSSVSLFVCPVKRDRTAEYSMAVWAEQIVGRDRNTTIVERNKLSAETQNNHSGDKQTVNENAVTRECR